MKCSVCGTEKKTKSDRVPRGWHRHNGIYCQACWCRLYSLRAIAMPIASPVGGWQDFRAAVKDGWAASTQIANWITTQLYVRDCRREPDVAKMPAMARTYLYPELRERWPEVSPQSVSSMEQDYSGQYRAKRYKVIWTAEESLPNYRYPEPIVCHNAAWKAYYDQERPCLSFRMGDARWVVRLKGGYRYRRALRAFSQFVSGDAVQGQMAIYRKRRGSGGDIKDRDSGKQNARYDVMIKMVGWFPKPVSKDLTGTLYVRTDPDALLVALNAKDERLWIWNADHLRRWVAEHRRQMLRWSDDQKAEQRPIAEFQSRRQYSAVKYRRRLTTAIQTAARQLVNYAQRRRFATIQYDDAVKTYVDRFPWHELKGRIETLCNELNIEFASVEVPEKTPAPLASEK